MGDFAVEVKAVGGHGCSREIKDGGTVEGCGRSDCPDCIARVFVEKIRATGCDVKSATLTHWPGQPESVVDDLLTKVRKGSFA